MTRIFTIVVEADEIPSYVDVEGLTLILEEEWCCDDLQAVTIQVSAKKAERPVVICEDCEREIPHPLSWSEHVPQCRETLLHQRNAARAALASYLAAQPNTFCGDQPGQAENQLTDNHNKETTL